MEKTSDTLVCGKRYMTMDQICQYLSVTKWTIYRLIDRREIPFAAVGKRSYRFDQEKIDEWMSKRTMKTKEEI